MYSGVDLGDESGAPRVSARSVRVNLARHYLAEISGHLVMSQVPDRVQRPPHLVFGIEAGEAQAHGPLRSRADGSVNQWRAVRSGRDANAERSVQLLSDLVHRPTGQL